MLYYDFDCKTEPHKWRCEFTKDYKKHKFQFQPDGYKKQSSQCFKHDEFGELLVDKADPAYNETTGYVPLQDCEKDCISPTTFNWVYVYDNEKPGSKPIEKCLAWTGAENGIKKYGCCCGEEATLTNCGRSDSNGRRRRRLLRSSNEMC